MLRFPRLNLSVPCAGPGVGVKVVVVARTRVFNAPLGEPFRVLTKKAAEKVRAGFARFVGPPCRLVCSPCAMLFVYRVSRSTVHNLSARILPTRFTPTQLLQVAHVRTLARTIDTFVDHYRLERDFPHLLDNDDEDDESEGIVGEKTGGPEQRVVDGGDDRTDALAARERQDFIDEEEFSRPEDMPVTIVVKADSANTLASVLDAVGDWGDVESSEGSSSEERCTERSFDEKICQRSSDGFAGNGKHDEEGPPGVLQPLPRHQEWGESDLQHKQRRRLVVSVARSGVGAVTSSDVLLARDCECPVFAHNVKTDATATRELKRVGGAVVPAMPEGAICAEETAVGVGGHEGFIGRAGEGRECVVVSETVGELLGEIERFVLRVR